MAGPALEHLYSYAFASELEADSSRVSLRLATSGGPVPNPHFFQGTLTAPRVTADLLLALVRVVRSRFHVPAAMLARILRESDPVVTCAPERLRFEGFSACCSAYARVDLLPESVDGALLAEGTTNVDFNAPMRSALTRLYDGDTARISVGASGVELESREERTVERKVLLPLRWLKGFIEVQSVQSRLNLRYEVSGTEARRFLRSLPRAGTKGRPAWVTASGVGLRLSQTGGRDAVRVGGIERLRLLEELSRYSRSLRIYAGDPSDVSAWELALPGARFHLVLSPEVWRGFSGEGHALSALADGRGQAAADRVRLALPWQPRVDLTSLAAKCGLGTAEAAAALARLAASGMVGYDLAEAGYFRRELPFDLSLIDLLQPRLKEARRIHHEMGVRLERASAEGVEAWVRGTGVEHHVAITPDGTQCSCPWYARHRGDRGPCKHVLAVQLFLEPDCDA